MGMIVWKPEVVKRAIELHEQGYGYRAISAALEEEFGVKHSKNSVGRLINAWKEGRVTFTPDGRVIIRRKIGGAARRSQLMRRRRQAAAAGEEQPTSPAPLVEVERRRGDVDTAGEIDTSTETAEPPDPGTPVDPLNGLSPWDIAIAAAVLTTLGTAAAITVKSYVDALIAVFNGSNTAYQIC